MFTEGQWMFAVFFVIAFAIVMVRKLEKLTNFNGN